MKRITLFFAAVLFCLCSGADTFTGIAPFPVFFSAETQTPASEYQWNFGDADSAYNVGRGYNAAHVYETPGSYTCSLVRDGKLEREHRIEVLPYTGPCVYVSTSGNDDSLGTTESTPVKSLARAVSLFHYYTLSQEKPAHVAVRFKRGDVWQTNNTSFQIPRTDYAYLYLGAYGTGPSPVLLNTGGGQFVQNLYPADNVRLCDLHLIGGKALWRSLGGDNHLMLRCTVQHTGNAWLEVNNKVARSGLFMMDCDVSDSGNPVYLGAKNIAILGNTIQRTDIEHVLRVWLADNGVIQYNVLLDPSIKSKRGNHALKLHSAKIVTWGHTQYVWVSDNVFRGSSWPVAIAPTDDWSPELVEQIVFERNTILSDLRSGKFTYQSLTLFASHIVTRDNTYVRDWRAKAWRPVVQRDIVIEGLPMPVGVTVQDVEDWRADGALIDSAG